MAIWEQQLPESPWTKLGFLPPLLLLLLLLILHLLQIFFSFRGLVQMSFWLQSEILASSNVSSKYLVQWKARKYLGQRVSSLWRRPDPRAFRSLLGLRSGTCSAPQDLLLLLFPRSATWSRVFHLFFFFAFILGFSSKLWLGLLSSYSFYTTQLWALVGALFSWPVIRQKYPLSDWSASGESQLRAWLWLVENVCFLIGRIILFLQILAVIGQEY